MTRQQIEKRVKEKELYGRGIAMSLIRDLYGVVGYDYLVNMPLTWVYDLQFKRKGTLYPIEVKVIRKDYELYPDAPIKKKKYDTLMDVDFPLMPYKVIYIVLDDVAGIAYIFNLSEIDRDDMRLFPLRQKRTQVDDDSDMVTEMMYSIPLDKAKKYSISKYLN